MRIEIDADRCTGHGRCYTLVPSLFDADDEGHSTLLATGDLTDEVARAAQSAVDNCPEQAITLIDD